jgi:hypothetical protein
MNNQKVFQPNKNNHSSNFTTMPLNKKKQKFVVKIIWGIDRIGSSFIFVKIKDVISSEYLDRTFIMLYQNQRINDIMVNKRINDIVDYLKGKFQCSEIPIIQRIDDINDNDKKVNNKSDKQYMFIKGYVFPDYISVRSFYLKMVEDIVVYKIGRNNIDPNIFTNNSDYLLKTGILNYM